MWGSGKGATKTMEITMQAINFCCKTKRVRRSNASLALADNYRCKRKRVRRSDVFIVKQREEVMGGIDEGGPTTMINNDSK